MGASESWAAGDVVEVTLPATAGANASSNATNTALVVDDLGRTGNDTFNVTIVAAAPGVSHATATWAADDTTTLGLLAVTASAVAAAACMHACAVQRQWPLALAACASACLNSSAAVTPGPACEHCQLCVFSR